MNPTVPARSELTSPGPWQPVGRAGSLYERVAAEIERLIETRQLRPGDRLPPERQLAVLLQVSRSSLREAMKMLEARGRLEVRHGRGITVREAEPYRLAWAYLQKEVGLRELFAMREVLEVPAVDWAARSAGDLGHQEIARAWQDLDRASQRKPPDWEELQRLDQAFHLAIAAAAGNRFLSRTIEVLQDMLSAGMETTLKIPGRLEKSQEDHRRINGAILRRDPRGARAAMRAHIRGARAAGLGRLERVKQP
ncbi:MAG: FadR family transcriptional regulator [Candidatus Nephthysia bennettiae]|nr:MAG: FadR family transcriptional regulator [Candidatus Dormibacteraeota bacterium]